MASEICRIEVQQNRVGAWGPTGLGPEPREFAERRATIWAENSPHNAYRVVAVDAPTPRPVMPGEALPPAPPAQDGPAPQLPRLQAQAWQARPATATDLPPAERPAWMTAPWAGQPLPELRAWHPQA
jgi:hypothetical protein